MKEHYFF